MRYLKKFNEDLNRDDLKDFCETQLAYLLDEDLELHIIDGFGRNMNPPREDNPLYIRLLFSTSKVWSEIKDQLIPFLIRLKNNYTIYTQDIEHGRKPYQIRLYIKPNEPNNNNGSVVSNHLNYMLDDIIDEKDLVPGFLFEYFKIDEIRIIVENDTPLVERSINDLKYLVSMVCNK